MKTIDITLVICGEAGQGIQTVGRLLSRVCHEAGLYVFAVNEFESRIRGGHSFFKLRISGRPVCAPQSTIHLLLAMDDTRHGHHQKQLDPEGMVVMAGQDEATEKGRMSVPFSDLAKKAGGVVAANTVAAGTVLALLGAPWKAFEKTLRAQFPKNPDKVRQTNLEAGRSGYDACRDKAFGWAFQWPTKPLPKGRLMNGYRAVAWGALAADCRFAAFYPMSPATGIIGELVSASSKTNLVVEQAEDEIAAVNMIIGAGFAGVRAMTATSGGGFCLMTEGIGLAAMTETPIVVVNAQRPGPATGMPTRTAQGDLLFSIHASQDDFPRFVFAPGSPAEAYRTTIRAFDLADKYQVPTIILTDQFLNDSVFTETEKLAVPESVKHYTVSDEDMVDPDVYLRYQITKSGVSPRALPCAGRALVTVCSSEHDEAGHINATSANGIAMADKRHAKWSAMAAEMRPPRVTRDPDGILLVGWGSACGAIEEAVGFLKAQGIKAGGVFFADLWPFPIESATSILERAERFLTVEQNQTAQLGQLIRQQTGLKPGGAVLKYDGRPFTPQEIIRKLDLL